MSVHDVILDLASHVNLPVTRRAEAPRVAGRDAATADTAFVIPLASVQAPNGRDLQRAPEGRNAEDMRVVYSTVELKLGGPGTGLKADLITIDGAPFEVEHVEHWQGFADDPGQHWRAVCRRQYAV